MSTVEPAMKKTKKGAKHFNWDEPGSDNAFIVGTMTGTSMDGIDVCLVKVAPGTWNEVTNRSSFASHPNDQGVPVEVIKTYATKFNASFRGDLQSFCVEGKPFTAGEICKLQESFAKSHCDAIKMLLESTKELGITREDLSLIVVHGQTVFHKPPLSWQMINPAPIALDFNTDVLFDLRAADLARGGQGAPITPLADVILFRRYARSWLKDHTDIDNHPSLPTHREDMWVVNLGGFCNITYIHTPDLLTWGFPQGRDVCAVNQLLDVLSEDLLNKPMDEDGATAAKGKIYEMDEDDDLYQQVEQVFSDFLGSQNGKAKNKQSLGTADSQDYRDLLCAAKSVVEKKGLVGWEMDRDREKVTAVILRAACGAIAKTIWTAIDDTPSWSSDDMEKKEKGREAPATVILAGGGALNLTLLEKMKSGASFKAPELELDRVVTSEEIANIGVCDRESVSMAVLGAVSRMGYAITHGRTTGGDDGHGNAGSSLFRRPRPKDKE